MPNYVRSSFCIDHSIPEDQYYDLLKILETHHCSYNIWKLGYSGGFLIDEEEDIGFTETKLDRQVDDIKLHKFAIWLAKAGHIEISFGWNIKGRVYDARLSKSSQNQRVRIMFAIEEDVFPLLPGTWSPQKSDPLIFEGFKDLVIHIVRTIRPVVGIIGYEVDLLCDSLEGWGVGWGNFISKSTLSRWPQDDIQSLHILVDEFISIDDIGIMIFLHPSKSDSSWKKREQEIEMIIQHNAQR